jgi:hypothetical protein
MLDVPNTLGNDNALRSTESALSRSTQNSSLAEAAANVEEEERGLLLLGEGRVTEGTPRINAAAPRGTTARLAPVFRSRCMVEECVAVQGRW